MHFVPLTAIILPFGSATAAPRDSLSARYGWQWMPFEVGLGAKLMDELYLGTYLNVGVGSEGSDLATSRRCDAGGDVIDDVSCSSVSVRLGIEARYAFTPAQPVTGWLGYGFGYTTASESISDAGRYSEISTLRGLELMRLSGGVDFRLSRGFGLGPFALASIGRYSSQRTTIRDIVSSTGDVASPALHAWVAVGLRMVIFP